eukprot:Awhi_evm1s12569
MRFYDSALFFLSLTTSFLSGSGRVRLKRGDNELAPELNRDHSKRHRRSVESLLYAVCFDGATTQEWNSFQEDYSEFIVKSYPNFEVAHLDIPDSLADSILLDIRSEPFVEAVEHVLDLHSSNMYWNKERIAVRDIQNVASGNSEFQGNGYGTYIYIIDSGIDDHLEFGSRIDREESRGFGTRTDGYDCRGHGTNVAGVAIGKDCYTGVVSTDVIVDALHEVHARMLTFPNRKVVVNLSNGLTGAGDTDVSVLNAEEQIKSLGGVVIRAAGNLGLEACQFGQVLPDSISVGSINQYDEIADHSNHGSCVDLFAPGVNIAVPMYSPDDTSGKGMGFVVGTSFAAPLVSGVAAILMANKNLRGQDIYDILLNEATMGAIMKLPDNTTNSLLHLPKATSKILVESKGSFLMVKSRKQALTSLCPEVDVSSGLISFESCVEAVNNSVFDVNAFEYKVGGDCVMKTCTNGTFVSWVDDFTETIVPGSVLQYVHKSLVPEQFGKFLLNKVDERDSFYTCLGGTKHAIESESSLYECLAKGEFAKANVVNYQLDTLKCELINCPANLPLIQTKANSTIANSTSVDDGKQEDKRSCTFVNSTEIDLITIEACSIFAEAEGGNAFQTILPLSTCE